MRWGSQVPSSDSALSHMSTRKTGTTDESQKVRKLLEDDRIKTMLSSRPTWAEIFKAAAKDTDFHCIFLKKALTKTKINGLANFNVPDITTLTFQFTIPSLSFVFTEMYKTLEVKLVKLGRGNCNISHYQDWVAAVEKLQQYIYSGVRVTILKFWTRHACSVRALNPISAIPWSK